VTALELRRFMATAAERQRLSRRRKKLRKMVCRQVEVTEQEVELLRCQGHYAEPGVRDSLE
jgi:hypothetical protein